MAIKMLSQKILWYLNNIFIVILFLWISLFPQPLQDKYRIYAQVFIGVFLLVLTLNKKYPISLQDFPLWLFAICLLSGTVKAIDRTVAWKTYSYIVVTILSLFYIGKGLFSNREDINKGVLVICICSSLVAWIGILELYFGKNILYENLIPNPVYERYIKSHRPMSTQIYPAVLASYLLGCLPFSLYLFRNKYIYKRLLGIFSFLLCFSVIILTFSRGVFLGLIVLLLFYLWKTQRKKLLVVFLFFLMFLIAVCPYFKNANLRRFGFERFIAGSQDSIISEYRLSRVKMTFRILKDYPLFGIGFNHFRLRFNEYCDKGGLMESYEFKIPDNMYLTFLAETGLIGTFGFLIFIFSLLKSGFRKLKELDGEDRYLPLIVISSLIGLLVNMGSYELFYWNNPYMFFCLLCGFIYGFKKPIGVLEVRKD